ncbi:MAG: ferrous iron transport protein A [Bacteroidales bacterium]|nr:ferrous iron transport protein A [Bacteroidales bacterium]
MKEGQTGIIVSVAGGKGATKRLADLGLSPGTEIKVIRKALFSGPVKVLVRGSRIVIGRGLALKIIVALK